MRAARYKAISNLRLWVRCLKPLDWLWLFAGPVLITVFAQIAFGQKLAGQSVSITSPNGEWRYTLEEDRIVENIGEDGECVIVIEDWGVFVRESNCPENICVRMGKISNQGEWIACVPHSVFISIDGGINNGMDDISY